MRRDSSALSRWFLAATNSWIHVSHSCRHCLTSRLLNRPISALFLLCVILILVCRGSRERRRSGRCDERIDLDVMRGWGQSVSLDVWHRDSRFHFHANLPCLFLNQTWPSQADDSRGLGPGDAFCLKPDTHTNICYSMKHAQWGKHSPQCTRNYICTHAHAAIRIYTQKLEPSEKKKSLPWFTVKEWYKGLKRDQIVFREPTLRADGSVFHLPSHEISFSVLCSAISLFFTIWVCFHKTPTESTSTKQITNKTNYSPEVLFVFLLQVLNLPFSCVYNYNHPRSRYPLSAPPPFPCLKPD